MIGIIEVPGAGTDGGQAGNMQQWNVVEVQVFRVFARGIVANKRQPTDLVEFARQLPNNYPGE